MTHGGVDALVFARRAEILAMARTHGARRVRVFGSLAQGRARPDSDLDLLVDLEPGLSLLDLVARKQDLEDLLSRPVDIVTEAAVSPHIRAEVVRDAIAL
jgi:predicted nucleotidyltransferase